MYIHKPLRITKGNSSHRNGPSSLLFIIIICPVDMNVYARFDEIPSITLKDVKKTKRNGRTTLKQYTHPQTQFVGGIITPIALAPSSYLGFIIYKYLS